MPSDEQVLALVEHQEIVDRIEVLEAESRWNRRKMAALSFALAFALGLGLVSPAWILVAGYPAWALHDALGKARLRRAETEQLRRVVGA